MLVYANEFYLKPDANDLANLKRAIKEWLGNKIGEAFSFTRIIPFAEPFTVRDPKTGINEVMIFGTPDEAPDYCLSINYRHNDASVHGRAWFTRIGIERAEPGAPFRVTILLETADVSPQVAAHTVTPSQPGIVHAILERCDLDERTPGASIRVLTAGKVERFREIVADPQRYHAILVISPDDFTENPSVDVAKLQQRLVGLAQIYEIKDKREAWKLRDLLPPYHTAWDGSVTLITPARFGSAYGRVYRQDEIEAICHDSNVPFERYLFSDLTHRFNLPKSRRHISDDVVGRRLVAFKLARLREQATGVEGLEDIVESYEEDRDKAKRHAEDLEYKLLAAEDAIEQIRDEKETLEKQIRTLQFHLKQARQNAAEGISNSVVAEESAPANLPELAELIPLRLGDKLILTNHAKKTLNNSPFEDVERAWAVFNTLATEFHAAFTGELRMQDAIEQLQQCSAKYAGNQSEITAGMKDGYERIHNGRKYKLIKHIGLGTARDPRYCFRLYFEWEPEERKIIVLHAGEHLNTQST